MRVPLPVAAAVCLLLFDSLSAVDWPDTPAARRLAELTELIQQATPDRVAGYIDEHYSPQYARHRPLDDRIDTFMDWHRRGGMSTVEVIDSQPHRIEVITRHPVTEERWRMALHTAPEPPHRIERLMVGPAPLPPLAEALGDSEVAERWLAYTEALAKAGLFSGAVLIARHGEVLGRGAWGQANRDFDVPNTVDTRFNLGSMNKTWTAVAIAQLVEPGQLAFDDSLARFIDYPDAGTAAKIRIEHLLTHTSGLGSYFTEEFDRSARKSLRSIDDFMALSAGQEPAFEPGTDWRYSNTGMLLLGKVIEKVTGQNYFDYIQRHVLDPAGMDRSGCLELDRVNDTLAVGYAERWSADGNEVVNNLFEHVVRGGPAGGCHATVDDLFRFASALHDGTLLSGEMAATLTTPKPALGAEQYGYGFGIGPNRAWHGHSGGFIGIGANLDIGVNPEGWVIVVLSNDGNLRAPMQMARHLTGLQR